MKIPVYPIEASEKTGMRWKIIGRLDAEWDFYREWLPARIRKKIEDEMNG